MKKNLLGTFVAIFFFMADCQAQITLAHMYPNRSESEVVNLSRSGKKILIMRDENSRDAADTLFFYNMDYSFWKSIICPAKPGYAALFNFFHDQGEPIGVFYPSEELYNTDTLLEVAVCYFSYIGVPVGNIYIINEHSVFTDSIVNVGFALFSSLSVFEDTPGMFKLIVGTGSGVGVFNLPGSIPCNECGRTYGLGETERPKEKSIDTHLMPNPSTDKVKITFTLPDGVPEAKLVIYNTNGQLIKAYTVDGRFGFITIDNSALPSGLYFYNIEVNGIASSTQKMVVIK